MKELPQAEIEAWQRGDKSLSDLAASLGVSKQAVGARLKRRGITRHAAQGASPTGSAASSTPAPAGDAVDVLMRRLQAAPDREAWLREVAGFADGISLSLLGQLHALANGENATAGAQQLKLVTQALAGVLENLEYTGRITSGEDADLESMRIVVMTPAEEAEIRERAEAEAQGMLTHHHDAPSEPTDRPPAPADDPATPTPAADAQPAHTAATDADSDDHPLAGPLRQLASREGVQRLRSVALSVGAPSPRGLDALVDALVAHAADDPAAATAIQAATERTGAS